MGHVPLRGLCVFSLECLCFSFFLCFFFLLAFLFVYMGVRLSVHGQNYGGCSFSPKALKMTCQFDSCASTHALSQNC